MARHALDCSTLRRRAHCSQIDVFNRLLGGASADTCPDPTEAGTRSCCKKPLQGYAFQLSIICSDHQIECVLHHTGACLTMSQKSRSLRGTFKWRRQITASQINPMFTALITYRHCSPWTICFSPGKTSISTAEMILQVSACLLQLQPDSRKALSASRRKCTNFPASQLHLLFSAHAQDHRPFDKHTAQTCDSSDINSYRIAIPM